MEEEVFVSLHNFFQIFAGDPVFHRHVLLGDAFPQDLRLRLQVYHQIGDGSLFSEKTVKLVVEPELGVTQIEVRKNLVSFEEIITDDRLSRR